MSLFTPKSYDAKSLYRHRESLKRAEINQAVILRAAKQHLGIKKNEIEYIKWDEPGLFSQIVVLVPKKGIPVTMQFKYPNEEPNEEPKWKLSIHMPKIAVRLWLYITGTSS
ncbi:hypothetical protein JYU20_00380 [Bacteroidales bacterium AH-315-I05]|nr:hypothetical protein [Bacteroidales bacterium AH-315-I05]